MRQDGRGAGRAARLVVPGVSREVPLLPRVRERLERAEGRLAVVTAPAGYGKTTQVAGWAAADGRRVAWVDLEEADNDPVALLSVLVEMLEPLEGFDPSTIPSPRGSGADFAAMVGPSFGRAVQVCETPFILVLDEVHIVHAQPAVDLLDALAWAVPPASTVVLVGRAHPRASLARLRAHRGIVNVTTAELVLDVADTRRVLEDLNVHLDPREVEELVRETEGWPVGVRLAAGALQHQAIQAEPSSGGFRGSRELADYLREEWLRGLSADDIELLTHASILDWLSGPLCDHVLATSGTGGTLRRVYSSRLVVIPLDRRDESYRMHHLLRDVLQAELEQTAPDAVGRYHVRASEWFEASGDIDRALRHARAAGDLARAERLVGDHTVSFHTTGRYATVSRWLAEFPDDYVTSRPSLCLTAALTALGHGDGASAATWVRFADRAVAMRSEPDHLTALQLDSFRSLISSTSAGATLEVAQRACRGLPPGIWHANACYSHGAASFALGDDETATAMFTEAEAEAQICGAFTLVVASRAHLAVIRGWVGDWSRATQLARSAREVMREKGLENMPTLIVATAMAALAEAMDGDFVQARADWMLTRQHLERYGTVATSANVQSRLALARTSLRLSDRSSARTLLDEVEAQLRSQPDAIRSKEQLAELDELVRVAPDAPTLNLSPLSRAELRVLHYLPTNLTLTEIAGQLFVSRDTVKSHAAAIYRKLGTNTRTETVDLARASGLLT